MKRLGFQLVVSEERMLITEAAWPWQMSGLRGIARWAARQSG